MGIRKSNTVRIESGPGQITMRDLRAFVLDASGAPDEQRVTLVANRFNHPTDHGEDAISVTWTTT